MQRAYFGPSLTSFVWVEEQRSITVAGDEVFETILSSYPLPESIRPAVLPTSWRTLNTISMAFLCYMHHVASAS